MGNNGSGERNADGSGFRRAIRVGLVVFFSAMLISYLSQTAVSRLSLFLAFPLLFLIILTGILFDAIGTAVTAADETPFHARGAKKVPGARQAINLIRNADKVANFSNDIVGDIAGTLSGATSTIIAFKIGESLGSGGPLPGIIAVGFVAALTVGGKAGGKAWAIRQANTIIFEVGRALNTFEQVTGISLLGANDKKPGRRRKS